MSAQPAQDGTLTWDKTCVSASKVESMEVVFGLAEGLTVVVSQFDGVALVASYARIPRTELLDFVAAVEANGRQVRIPRRLRRD